MTERFSVSECDTRQFEAIIAVQHQAFGRVARELGIDPAKLPPLRETAADLARLGSEGVRFFIAAADGQVIGSVRALDRCPTVEIGRLVVATDWVRQGVASALMRTCEAAFPDAESFSLFTGADAIAPLRLYERCGYRRTRSEQVGGIDIVWLEKRRMVR